MPRGHDGRQLVGDIELGIVSNTCGGGVLARENGPGVNCLALGVHERQSLVESLGRGEPLERRAGGRGGKE